jgi:hypothetical protein
VNLNLNPGKWSESELVDRLAKGSIESAPFHRAFEVPVGALNLTPGKRLGLAVSVYSRQAAISDTAGNTETTIWTDYDVLALPNRPGFCGGDGQVHSWWSAEPLLTEPVLDRARYAAQNGQGFIVITDHASGVNARAGGWPAYVKACNEAQAAVGIAVLPGIEVAASPSSHGHALGYAMKETADSAPQDDTYDCQGVIDHIRRHNLPRSYSTIAHPFSSTYPWYDWGAVGLTGMELMTQTALAHPPTIARWFSLLRNGLPKTMQTGRFVVGTGGSDCHHLMAPGHAGFMWVQVPGYGAVKRDSIWEAIRAGRVSVSGRKDLGFFSLNGYPCGSVVSAKAGSPLAFRLIQQPVTGRKCVAIAIYDAEQNQVGPDISDPRGDETEVQIGAPGHDTFYVVKFVFAAVTGADLSEVWANPVFVRVK